MIVAITLPYAADGETEAVARLAEAGAIIHLRKDDASELEEAVKGAADLFDRSGLDKSRLRVHHNFLLCQKYGIGGVHRRFVERGEPFGDRLSVSCHSFGEATAVLDEATAEYLFLSPIFDSNSKKGYKAAFMYDELRAFLLGLTPAKRDRVIALGGIDDRNVAVCADMGFGGCAMIGSIWCLDGGRIDPKRTLENFLTIREKWLCTKR